MIRIRNRNQRREVHYRVALLHCAAHPMRIADIAGKYFEFSLHVSCAMIEPAPRIKRVVKNEGAHVVSCAYQRLSQVGADEAIRTSYKYFSQGPSAQEIFVAHAINKFRISEKLTLRCIAFDES